MANGAVAAALHRRTVAKASANQKQREQAQRREAMEPIRLALKREGRPQTWLMRQLDARANLHVSQSTLYAYLGGYARVRREFVASACLIAGANIGDVYARVKGREDVLFQPEK